MPERRLVGITLDRRFGIDRRKAYDLDYLSNGGVERRRLKERRSLKERRAGWMPAGQGSSVFVGTFEKKSLQPART